MSSARYPCYYAACNRQTAIKYSQCGHKSCPKGTRQTTTPEKNDMYAKQKAFAGEAGGLVDEYEDASAQAAKSGYGANPYAPSTHITAGASSHTGGGGGGITYTTEVHQHESGQMPQYYPPTAGAYIRPGDVNTTSGVVNPGTTSTTAPSFQPYYHDWGDDTQSLMTYNFSSRKWQTGPRNWKT